uniref:Glycosyltransferase n=1 Tax=uncultured bacterium HF186_25m_13D19 TaxID=662888 RepID=C7FPH7_9BACT|nr:glycosyltransferase [uncultured bacterium HF186_25m_13D19]
MISLSLCAISLLSLMVYLVVFYRARGVPELIETTVTPCATWPTVSLIVPACNEASTIEAALRSILACAYPALEVLVVNDRSTDATGAMIDDVARGDARVVVHHIEALPEGWLGKVHAMHIASREAKGDYVIYADADVHLAPGALQAAVAWAERERIDMMALIPKMHAEGVLLNATLGGFGGFFLAGTNARAVNRDSEEAYAGVGAFSMVRRSVFEASPGWEWLRLEIADDLGLALMMHRAGARGRIALAPRLLSLRWYTSLGGFIRGLEKNMFPVVARFSPLRACVITVGALMMPLSPLLLLFGPYAWLGGLTLGLNGLLCFFANPAGARPLAYLLSPLAPCVMALILMRSTFKALIHGTVSWRGTRYDLASLKTNQRVHII